MPLTDKQRKAFEAVCERIAMGESLRSICRDKEMPGKSTVLRWLMDEPELWDQYARARELQAEGHADELIDIADDGSNDWMDANDPDNPGYRMNGEALRRSELRVNTRKWVASKLKPKVYGDKQQHEVSGGVTINVVDRFNGDDTE